MKEKISIFSLSVLLTFSLSANENVIIESEDPYRLVILTTVQYSLGDSDSRIEAKKVAMQNAHAAASIRAGSYVQSEKIIRDGVVSSEAIISISTALFSSQVIEEEYSLTATNRSVLTLKVRSILDKSSLMAKLGILSSNQKLRDEIERLSEINKKLNIDLYSEINSSLDTRNGYILPISSNKKSQIVNNIIMNSKRIERVFSEGEIIAIYKEDIKSFDIAIKNIDDNIYDYIISNMKLNLGDPVFRKSKGGTFSADISLSFDLNNEPINKILGTYFKDNLGGAFENSYVDFTNNLYRMINGVGSYAKGAIVDKAQTKDHLQTLPAYTLDLYEYMLKKRVLIVVEFAGKSVDLVIASNRSCAIRCRGLDGSSQYQIHTSNLKQPNNLIESNRTSILTITGLTMANLAAQNVLSAHIEIVNVDDDKNHITNN